MNNTTYKISNVKKLLLQDIERVDDTMWKTFIKHTTVYNSRRQKELFQLQADTTFHNAEYIIMR